MSESTGQHLNILDLVNRTLELPTIPEVLAKLNSVTEDPDSSADDVAAVISRDPAVATNVLRIVNSAYYGLQVRVSSISLAVSVMGFNMTKKVALKAAVFSVFGKRRDKILDNFDPIGFWRHAIYTATAARELGRQSPMLADSHPEDLYVCGLLHDIGKIILLEKAPKQYLPLLEECARAGCSELDLEQEHFGFTHADVGSVLAIKWFLPEDLTIGIRYHHAPSKDPFHQSLSSLIHLADHVAWSAGEPSTRGTPSPALEHEVYDFAGLDLQEVEDLLPQIQEEYDRGGTPW